MREYPPHSILAQPHTYELIRLDWQIDPHDNRNSCLDMTLQRGEVVRRLRFLRPTKVKIDSGFNGHCSGMMVLDIRNRGWEDLRVEVINVEPQPGITLYAADVVDLDQGGGL